MERKGESEQAEGVRACEWRERFGWCDGVMMDGDGDGGAVCAAAFSCFLLTSRLSLS